MSETDDMTGDVRIQQWIADQKRLQAENQREFLRRVGVGLRVDGFQRSGGVFRRTVGIDTQILDLEADHGSFRVNIGVYFPDLALIFSNGLDQTEPIGRRRAWRCSIAEYLHDINRTVPESAAYDPTTVVEWLQMLRTWAIPWLETASLPTYNGIKTPELNEAFQRMWVQRARSEFR